MCGARGNLRACCKSAGLTCGAKAQSKQTTDRSGKPLRRPKADPVGSSTRLDFGPFSGEFVADFVGFLL